MHEVFINTIGLWYIAVLINAYNIAHWSKKKTNQCLYDAREYKVYNLHKNNKSYKINDSNN